MTSLKNRKKKSYCPGLRPKIAGLLDVVSDSIRNFFRNDDTNQAAAIAFYAIVSLIPLFILTLWIGSLLFGSPSLWQAEIAGRIKNLNPSLSEHLLNQIGHIEQKKALLGWVGLLTLLWSSSLIFDSIQSAFRTIFPVEKGRNYFVSKALALFMIPAGWLVGLVDIALTSLAALINSHAMLADPDWIPAELIAFGTSAQSFFWRYSVPYAVMACFLAGVYKVVPVGRIPWRIALAGGFLCSALLEVAKHVFAWYLATYTRYGVIYGSLQTLVILVVWVYYAALIFLFCAELIASWRRRVFKIGS